MAIRSEEPQTRRIVGRFRIIGLGLSFVALGGIAWVLIASGLAGPLLRLLSGREMRDFRPALFQSAPLRTSRGGSDRIYLVSTQSETQTQLSGRMRISDIRRNLLHVDLWAIDATSTTLAWRKRLRTYDDEDSSGIDLRSFAPLGVDGTTLWLTLDHAPVGISLADGDVVADGNDIDAKNPQLAGKRVNEAGYVAFGRHGLQITLDDGSQWRIDATDLSAAHRDTPLTQPDNVQDLASYAASGTNGFMTRGMPLETRWLGLLTNEEAETLSNPPVIPGRDPAERPGVLMQHLKANHVPGHLNHEAKPYRLWSARIQQVSAAPPDWPKDFPDNWGTRTEFSRYEVLPESPAFLRAGLLCEHREQCQPLWYRDPDSMLVLHPDKLGQSGRLHLTRVSGPHGLPTWSVALPFTDLVSVMRNDNADLVLLGTEPASVPGANEHDTDPHMKITRIAIADGSLSVLDLTAESFKALEEP